MNAPVALLVVLLSQLVFWALLRAGFFLTALGANVVFWCVAFPAWTEAGRRWWKTSVTPDVALVLMLIALTVCAFLAAARGADGGGASPGAGSACSTSPVVADCDDAGDAARGAPGARRRAGRNR